MANRAGLRKVVKTVRTKNGVARRSYWVRAGQQVKAGGIAASAVGALVSSGFVGMGLGQRAGEAMASRRAGQIFHAGIAGRTAESLNRGSTGAYNHMKLGGIVSGIGGAALGTVAGGYVAGRLANYGRSHGLFKANTIAARRVGGIIGAVGGITLALAATHYGETGRAAQFRAAYNQRVREVYNRAGR